MKAKCKQLLAPAMIGAALLQLTACGGGGGGGGGTSSSGSQPRQFESEAEGTYVAEMQVMNRGVGGAISSSLSITKDGERMIAYIRFNGGMPSVSHQQRVHVGTACPTQDDDKNGDGYVDINEAYDRVGKILFPLDADISSQERGMSLWPMADIYGSYNWERATNFQRFISDLREPDLNGDNDFAKLGPGGALNLDGRVVLFHGTNKETSNLPDTVGTRGRLANFQTIPIACGVIRKVSTVPGAPENDPSLGPATGDGETVGGSSGADDGATVPVDGAYRPGETTGGETGGATSGSTTGTNTDNTDDGNGGFHWPWERHPRTTTGGTGGGTTGGATSGGSTSGGTTSGGSTSGETTSGGTSGGTTGGTSGGTSGGTTTGGETGAPNYGDDGNH